MLGQWWKQWWNLDVRYMSWYIDLLINILQDMLHLNVMTYYPTYEYVTTNIIITWCPIYKYVTTHTFNHTIPIMEYARTNPNFIIFYFSKFCRVGALVQWFNKVACFESQISGFEPHSDLQGLKKQNVSYPLTRKDSMMWRASMSARARISNPVSQGQCHFIYLSIPRRFS